MKKKWSYLFWILLLAIFIRLSLDAGISGDEYLHLRHSYLVLDYFKTLGKDRAALYTPKTFLQYYGQSFDNLATLISEVFNIEDIFTLRHILNAVAGWLVVLFTFLTARELGGKRVAVIATLLLLLSPRFIGHSFNNLKDIPFALGFIASLFFIIKYLGHLKDSPFGIKTGIAASIAFTISIRPAGLLIIIYMWLFAGIRLLQLYKFNIREMWPDIKTLLFISLAGYFAGLLFWPYALENPIWHPIQSTIVMTDYYITIRQLFEGKLTWSDHLPWYYLIKYISITVPVMVPAGIVLSIGYFKNKLFNRSSAIYFTILLFFAFFPLIFIILRSSNVYGGWRHVIFIYPSLIIISSLGFNWLREKIKNRTVRYLYAAVVLLFLAQPFLFMVRNHPYEVVYFNPFVGGIKGARGNYEMDYYFHSTRGAAGKLREYLSRTGEKDVIIGGNFETAWFFRHFPAVADNVYTPYYYRNSKDWDYDIITAAYMTNHSLQPGNWPPENTILTIDVDSVPICAVLKRQTKDDLRAMQLIKEGNADSAVVILESVIKKYPKNETAYLELGKAYIKMARYLLAIKTFERSLKMLPGYEPVMYYLAEARYKAGDINKAVETLNQLLKVNSKYLLAYITLADYYRENGEKDKAIGILNKCLEVKPRYKKALDKLKQLE